MRNDKENIIVRLSFDFALAIIEFSETLYKAKKFVISVQILKSGTSIGANIKEAQKYNNRLNQIFNELFIEVNPIPVKYAASLMGICDNSVRLPLVTLSKENEEVIEKTLQDLELL